MNNLRDIIKIVRYLLEHRDTNIPDEEIEKLAPYNCDAILKELENNQVLALTKDGVSFDTSDIPALQKYLKKRGITA